MRAAPRAVALASAFRAGARGGGAAHSFPAAPRGRAPGEVSLRRPAPPPPGPPAALLGPTKAPVPAPVRPPGSGAGDPRADRVGGGGGAGLAREGGQVWGGSGPDSLANFAVLPR